MTDAPAQFWLVVGAAASTNSAAVDSSRVEAGHVIARVFPTMIVGWAKVFCSEQTLQLLPCFKPSAKCTAASALHRTKRQNPSSKNGNRCVPCLS